DFFSRSDPWARQAPLQIQEGWRKAPGWLAFHPTFNHPVAFGDTPPHLRRGAATNAPACWSRFHLRAFDSGKGRSVGPGWWSQFSSGNNDARIANHGTAVAADVCRGCIADQLRARGS